ncbi:RNA polymerase sigma-70 factor, ECF subfamily [Variovorax sp. HW608]|uniref:RNA polymerase sigma factor n=1 Tax=Variovorax sp. HW608 TaxID=1034889 RepID=UPI000820034E|nr:RNA polymerase sigma factor [Variovorax sp. HW608]SCK48607.1 RNA polymerase sigma-70 factor, ECF subfamily [Variovorax sp. HW608]
MSHIASTPTPSCPPSPQDSDAGLAVRAAGGEGQAFALIMRRHNQLLFRTARSILRNDDEAEDALQEAYLRAWRAIGSFREEARLSTWLARIVINEALARLRRHGAQVIPLDSAIDAAADTGEPWEEADPDLQPERMAMRQEIRNLIERRIDRLPEAYRTVFMLRAVQEMSVSETAEALQLNEATVRTRFLRARGMLREHLSRDIDLALGDAFSFAGARCDRIVAGVLARIDPTHH